jgi:hypothetical protein
MKILLLELCVNGKRMADRSPEKRMRVEHMIEKESGEVKRFFGT